MTETKDISEMSRDEITEMNRKLVAEYLAEGNKVTAVPPVKARKTAIRVTAQG